MTLIVAGTASDFPLTDEQQAIVDCDAAALVATASAGTGKTEILARRVERFVNDPSNGSARVLVITYTTRAANEFRSRLRGRVGESMRRVSAETIHAFAHSILSTHGSHIGLPIDFGVITNNEDRADLLARYDSHLTSDDYPQLFRQLDLARAECRDDPLLKIWRNALQSSGVLDFNEMVTKATDVLQIPAVAEMFRSIYGLVVVDEAQNLTRQQYRLITAFVGQREGTGRSLIPTTLLGDPNQSVTGFAGGDNTLMSMFADDFHAQEFMLTQNFRSSKRLATLERTVSQQLGDDRTRPSVRAERSAEGVIDCREFPDEATEASCVADWVARLLDEGLPPAGVSSGEPSRAQPEDIAVLARHSATLSAASEALAVRGYEVARSHSDDDFMATPVGAVAVILMRSHSPRHQMAASGALRRELELSDLDFSPTDSRVRSSEIADALHARADEHLDVLVPLLSADNPSEFVEALEECQLPETSRDEMLAGWLADRRVIEDAWSEFASVTPVAERSWSRLALYFDRAQRARDLGAGVRLLTVQKAQGREFQAVAIVGMNDGQFPDFRATSTETRKAELQTFYVAVTRASRMLLLTRACVRPTRFGPRVTQPSPYLQLVKKVS